MKRLFLRLVRWWLVRSIKREIQKCRASAVFFARHGEFLMARDFSAEADRLQARLATVEKPL